MATPNTFAWAYDQSGNRRTMQPIDVGYEVDWKRGGCRGSFRARVVEIKPLRIKLQLLKYSDNPRLDLNTTTPVWVKPDFLRIYPA